MRALTLTQPWAGLVASGIKRHWMQDAPPHSIAWHSLIEHAVGRGLVHAMHALPLLEGNYSPADVASLLAEMVGHGVLEPVKLDLAGAGHSVRAFRGFGPSAGGKPSAEWSRAEAHLWTYRAP